MTQHIEEEKGEKTTIPIDNLDAKPKPSRFRLKIEVFILAAELLATMYFIFYEYLSLYALARQETIFKDYGSEHPWMIVGLVFLLYVTVTAFSLPAAAAFTMGIGWLFKILFGEPYGLLGAVVLISFASTSGATLAFLMSRYLFRDAIQKKFGSRLKTIDDALEREGAFYLFTLRLIPAIPFFAINVVMGLTPIRVWTYWWVSQIGMFPGTCIYVYAGSAAPTVRELAEKGTSGIMKPEILIAFILLALFPIVVKRIMGRFRGQQTSDTDSLNSPDPKGNKQ